MRVTSVSTAIFFASLIALSASGCGGTPPTDDFPCTTHVTFKTVQSTIFDTCGPNCHQMSPPSGGLDLSSGQSYSDLLHAQSRSSQSKFLVEPADPDHSFLWQKLQNRLDPSGREGVAMPRDPRDQWSPLTHDQLSAVYCWIKSGAKND